MLQGPNLDAGILGDARVEARRLGSRDGGVSSPVEEANGKRVLIHMAAVTISAGSGSNAGRPVVSRLPLITLLACTPFRIYSNALRPSAASARSCRRRRLIRAWRIWIRDSVKETRRLLVRLYWPLGPRW